MDKLTTEQKAKAYDEALSVARKTYQTQPMYRDWLEKMFPELAESEDKRIRKALYLFVEAYGAHSQYATQEDMLAWLEAQGEQKSYISETMEEKHDFDSGFTKMMEKEQNPADKVEPKFKKD